MRATRGSAVIVGAGASGLACAERLILAGLDVTVLEARHRTGGRVWTNYELAPGVPVEMGALMIHGRHVATHRWAREMGIVPRAYPTTWRARFVVEGHHRSTLGSLLPQPGPFGPTALWTGLHRLPKALGAYSGPELTLAQFLATQKVPSGAGLIVKLLHAHTWAADADEVGVRASNREDAASREPYGFRNFRIREGYSEVMRRHTQRVGERVRTGYRVRSIDWSESPLRVSATNTITGEDRTFPADYVVVTVPLGVLRAGEPAFDPPLPVEKQRAIGRIGFGRAISVALRFPSPSLRRSLGREVLIWAGGASTFLRPGFSSKGCEGLFAAFTVGREAERRAGLADRELIAATAEELRSALPGVLDDRPPSAWAITRWVNDPFVRGAYSFPSPQSEPNDRLQLASPLSGRLFFAGEATHTEGEPSTVHGALETGWRAAEEVIAASERSALSGGTVS